MSEQRAQLNYLRMAPRKVRLVASAIRGLPVNEAEALLSLHNRRAAEPVLKLLRSAVSNAKNNQRLDPEKLFVKEVSVDGGPMLKRFMPRAMGRATPIQKKTSHITIILGESESPKVSRFAIVKKEKISKMRKTEKAKKPQETQKPKLEEKPKVVKEPGFMKKIFRRKSI